MIRQKYHGNTLTTPGICLSMMTVEWDWLTWHDVMFFVWGSIAFFIVSGAGLSYLRYTVGLPNLLYHEDNHHLAVSNSTAHIVKMTDFVVSSQGAEPHSYIAIADGHKGQKMAEVYAGFYDYDDATIKCSKQQCVSIVLSMKPGNHGKCDSQIVLIAFLHKVMSEEKITIFEYEFFNPVWRVAGIVQINTSWFWIPYWGWSVVWCMKNKSWVFAMKWRLRKKWRPSWRWCRVFLTLLAWIHDGAFNRSGWLRLG